MYFLEVKIPTKYKNDFVWWLLKTGDKQLVNDYYKSFKEIYPNKEFRCRKISNKEGVCKNM